MALEHIKIPAITPFVVYQVGGTAQTLFTIPFTFFESKEIQVFVGTTPLTIGVDYGVVGTGGYDKGFPGGFIILVAPVANNTVIIRRWMILERLVDFPNSGPLNIASLNTTFDKLIAIDQQLNFRQEQLETLVANLPKPEPLPPPDPRLDRAILLPVNDPTSHEVPLSRAGHLFGFSFATGAIEMQRGIVYPSSEQGPPSAILPAAGARANTTLGFDAVGALVVKPPDDRLDRAMLFPVGDPFNHVIPASRAGHLFAFDNAAEMRMERGIIYPPGEAGINSVLPIPATRANKVIGFDSLGDLSLNSVFGGSVLPNAGNIDYTAPPPPAVLRNVANKLDEFLSIKDFGSNVGTGDQAADDAALVAAITYFNSIADADDRAFSTLHYPDGVYSHGPCAVPILCGRFAIRGNSDSGTMILFMGGGTNTWLTLGDATHAVDHVTVSGLSIDNIAAPVSPGTTLFKLANSRDCIFRQLYLRYFDTICSIGTSGGALAIGTSVQQCTGFSRNKGRSAFELVNGQIFACHGVSFRVDGVPIPAANTPLATTAGTNVFLQVGSFQVVLVQRCLFSYFDYGLVISANDGVSALEYWITDVDFVYCKHNPILLFANTGGVVQAIQVHSCRFDSWETEDVLIGGPGINDFHSFIGNNFSRAGRDNFLLTSPVSNLIVANNRFFYSNTFASTGLAAITLAAGGGGAIIIGNVNHLGAQRAPWGIYVAANVDDYMISNNMMMGATGSIHVEVDSLASKKRRIHNNTRVNAVAYQGYAGVSFADISGGNYTNTTPFPMSVCIDAGTINSASIDGIAIGNHPGPWNLEPGSTLAVSASGGGSTGNAVPTLIINISG
jgi:hypothetical protein